MEECCICMEVRRFYCDIPCKHKLCVCCLSKLQSNTCPFCRAEFNIQVLLAEIKAEFGDILPQLNMAKLSPSVQFNSDIPQLSQPASLNHHPQQNNTPHFNSNIPQFNPSASSNYHPQQINTPQFNPSASSNYHPQQNNTPHFNPNMGNSYQIALSNYRLEQFDANLSPSQKNSLIQYVLSKPNPDIRYFL